MTNHNQYTLSGKNSSGKSFAGEKFRHLAKISSLLPDENFTRIFFVTFPRLKESWKDYFNTYY